MLNMLRRIKHGFSDWQSTAVEQLAESYVDRLTKSSTISGVFSGIRLTNKHVFGSRIPKLLGSYEKELFPHISAAFKNNPRIVCNIGAAEGYYVVGCAKSKSVTHVYAYEALEEGRGLIKSNIILNNVENLVTIKGICDEKNLYTLLKSTRIDLMLIDIEGNELDILSDRNVDLLSNTELIIESHDFCRSDCLNILVSKFKPSHNLEVVNSKQRIIEDFPSHIWMPAFLKLRLMDEMRPGIMNWLVCLPQQQQT